MIIFLIIVLVVWFLTAPIRKRRDRERWESWNRALALAKDNNCNLGRVTSIRQRAGTGTKAYVTWVIGPGPSAIWIPNSWPKVWNYLLVSGSVGDGPHHNETVFYVNNLKKVLPGSMERGWNRHNERLRISQKKNEKEGCGITEPEQEDSFLKYPVSRNEEHYEFYKDPTARGSFNYFEIEPDGPLLFSEGVNRMCDCLDCYWIVDIVASKFDQIYQRTVKNPYHYLWRFFFIKNPKKGIILIIEEYDFEVIVQEEIHDQYLSKNIHLMVNCRAKDSLLFLPSEY